jgi:uncharacterized protein (TIGR03437 family)
VLDEVTGYEQHLLFGLQGSTELTAAQLAAIFGTTRLAPWGSLQGTLCWSDANAPSTNIVQIATSDDFGDEIVTQVDVTLTGPAVSPAQLSVSPASITFKPSTLPIFQTPLSVTVNLSDKTQPWTATVFPANRTTTWLQLSQYSGAGPATITLQANGAGFEPGVYRATIVIQSPNSVPQWVAAPVMFVNSGTAGGPAVSSVGNAISFTPAVSPGSIMAIYGTQLASSTQSAASLPLGYSMTGVSATVNGWPAPLFYVSPTQLNVLLRYEAGSGPAVLGINNNGQIGGFEFQISPSGPGILGVGGSLYPSSSAPAGSFVTMYVTGLGDINQTLASGLPVATGTPAAGLPRPLLPVNVTVGGLPAFIQFAGVSQGIVGLEQVNFVVPSGVAPGVQPVVITSGGAPSSPVNLAVTERP